MREVIFTEKAQKPESMPYSQAVKVPGMGFLVQMDAIAVME